MADKPSARTFRSGEWSASSRTARSRREQIRRRAAREARNWRGWWAASRLQAGLVAMGFALVASLVLIWAREQPIVAAGRVVDRTRLVRTDFEIKDDTATAQRREVARSQAPRVYVADQAVFQELQSSLEGLPTALADAQTLDKVAPKIREDFGLTQDRLDAIRQNVVAGEADQAWASKVRALMQRLGATPIVDRETYQLQQQQPGDLIELRMWDAPPALKIKGTLLNVEGDQLKEAMREAVQLAGFRDPAAAVVLERLTRHTRPTFTFNEAFTVENRDKAALGVRPVMVQYKAGRVIAPRGGVWDKDAVALSLAEDNAYWSAAGASDVWLGRLAEVCATLLITAAGVGYLSLYAPRIRRSPARMAAVAAVLAITLGASVVGGVLNPGRMALASIAPVVFSGMILAVAYDQRSAIALAAMQTLLVTLALQQGVAFFGATLAGCCVAIWRLRDIRHRNSLIYAGLAAGLALAAGVAVGEMLEYPIVPALVSQVVFDALLAALGGLLVGFVLLGILPAVERLFDVTTGLTLIELRDPKQPLLRELQKRAPGTYSHSLTVATLAESAADAIGADGLHLYVGALYHDIGKMNKPDYFVENQTGSFNRHEKLSPAMSLLVIVGHVKDGVELAKEYNLPRSLHHYIESHHGTTLVEYFFHAARRRADESDSEKPAEIEYRYAGPKPRTKEAAILMLCDAVESATRAMSDPTPSRIEALVHDLALKRLLDGQFDESELTLHELNIVEASLVKTLCSVYHGRIAYPSGLRDDDRRTSSGAPPSGPAKTATTPPAQKAEPSPTTASRTA